MKAKHRIIPGWIAVLASFTLLLSACGGGTDQSTTAATPTPTTETEQSAPLEVTQPAPAATEPVNISLADKTVTTASGLQYIELAPGDGPKPESGEIVFVHYIGRLDDGTEFDNSYRRGQPLRFVLGNGSVIPGWEEGISMMNKGGKARLIIPPYLAYGERGVGSIIPPDATLVFDVELVDIQPGDQSKPTAVDEADYVTTESGLKYFDIKVGEGEEPKGGQLVAVHYIGWLADGTKVDSSRDRGTPFTFILDDGIVIPGWDEGVATMKVGGVRQLVIPPDLAYGAEGAGNVIPPDATLIFEIELLSAEDR